MISPTTEELEFIRACRINTQEERFLEQCSIYGDFLYETNETMNLTRIPPEEFWTKHICDSLSLAMRWEMPRDGHHVKMCDVGCGAGLPSLILAAALPDLEIVPVDSTGKKIEFVRHAASEMGLSHVHAVHARANELARKAPWRGSFRYVSARAVAAAPLLKKETFGLLRQGGCLAIYRTMSQAGPELPELRKAGCRVRATEEFLLPGESGGRMFLLIEKG